MKVNKLTDEWNQYCLEVIKKECYESNDGKSLRVDFCWNKTELIKDGMGHTKYHPTLLYVVKAALTLAHGNAEVERGFSNSYKTAAVDRTSLSEAFINSLQIGTVVPKMFGSLSHHVPITRSFIKLN